MVQAKTIILGVVVVITLYLLYSYFFADNTSSTLVKLHDASQALTIPANNLPGGVTSDYTYSIWVYINSWSTGYGQQKVIFERKDGNGNVSHKLYWTQISTMLLYCVYNENGGAHKFIHVI